MIYNAFSLRPEPKHANAVEYLEQDGSLPKEPQGVFSNCFRNEFNKKFVATDEESSVWDKAVFALWEKPTLLAKMLRKNKSHLNLLDTNIYFLINYFGTDSVRDEIKLAQLAFVKNNDEISQAKMSADRIMVTKKDGTVIESKMLSKTFDWIKHDLELVSPLRMGKSHKKSISIARCLAQPCHVVTGHISGITNKSKYLHTWVETMIDGKEVVIDYTMNSVMNKKGYYSLMHAKSISKIAESDLEEDLKFVAPMLKNNSLAMFEYLVYRDQIMENISLNAN